MCGRPRPAHRDVSHIEPLPEIVEGWITSPARYCEGAGTGLTSARIRKDRREGCGAQYGDFRLSGVCRRVFSRGEFMSIDWILQQSVLHLFSKVTFNAGCG